VKISLQRDALLSQLQTVTRVASTRSAIQALSGVQIVVSSTSCELRATDMDVSLRVPLEAEVAPSPTPAPRSSCARPSRTSR
jgi:DNA polymerase-3 subunit beta